MWSALAATIDMSGTSASITRPRRTARQVRGSSRDIQRPALERGEPHDGTSATDPEDLAAWRSATPGRRRGAGRLDRR